MTVLRSSNAHFFARRERVTNAFAERKVDALLVNSAANVRYLAGFTGSNGLVLLAPRRAFLFTDPRYTLQAARESDCRVVVPKAARLLDAALAALRRLRAKRIGVEAAHLDVSSWQHLNAHLAPSASLVSTIGWIEQLRMHKDAGEIDLIRQSVALNSKVYSGVLARLRPGASEREIAAELAFDMRRGGADGEAFNAIVASGANSALPHATPSAAVLKRDQVVLIDMGAMLAGYASDMTRTVFLGTAPRRLVRVYRAVQEAQEAALAAVRAGIPAERVDGAARKVLEGHGLGAAFLHSTGHGLGLEIHEPPRIGRREKTRLAAGMVITIEPGAYIEGLGGVRIEDTVLVTDNGCEVLTPTSKELTIL